MRIQLLIFILIFFSCSGSTEEYGSTMIKNVNVVDVLSGKIIEKQTVVLRDSLIDYVGADWDGKATDSIDGEGLYMIPGLWDMHFHLAWEAGNDTLLFPMLMEHGITGIRDMGGDLTLLKRYKDQLAENPSSGPELIGAGPIIDGNPPVMFDFSLPVDAQSNIPSLLDSLRNGGADFYKSYSLIREAELSVIASHSTLHGLSFSGHLSEYVEPEISIALGQKSVEHLNRLDEIWETEPSRLETIADSMMIHQTWLCPTMMVYRMKGQQANPSVAKVKYSQFVHPILQAEWEQSRERLLAGPEDVDWEKNYRSQASLLSFLHQKGVALLAGSDFGGMPFVYPGIGLHQELELLVDAGLSPAEALATATINPARFLDRHDQTGSIETGRIADIILLNANPLDAISNTQAINQVYRRGKRVR